MAPAHFGELFLFCLLLLGLAGKVAPDLKISVPQCCQIGINWHKEGLKCHNHPKPVANIPDSDQAVCFKTLQLCCEENLRQKRCRNGIKNFKREKSCPSGASDVLDKLEEKCCTSCHLGTQLGQLRVPCSSIDIPIEEELKNAMLSCCGDVSRALKIEKSQDKFEGNQSAVPMDASGDYDDGFDDYGISSQPLNNLCDLLPGQLCAHICVPTRGSYYCKCEEGYMLMEDQKTCTKDDFQPIKQRPSSTVFPQVIIPNPEKPVPLHKPKGSKTVKISTERLATMMMTTTTTTPLTTTMDATSTSVSMSCVDGNDCEQVCLDTDDGYKCGCEKGFELMEDGKSCGNVSGCEDDDDNCQPKSKPKCVNEAGENVCERMNKTSPETLRNEVFTVPVAMTTTVDPPMELAVVPRDASTGACPTGFEEILGNCTDINECDYGRYPEACKVPFECINTPGSYLCRCKTGFQENPSTHQCEDINECQTNLHNCLASQRCDNSIGSFRCVRFTGCGTGYTLNSQTGLCEDDDECLLGTDNCRFLGPNYICRNTLGSFRCERKRCLPGDNTCDPEKQCPTGYVQSESGNCVDLDECSTGVHNCHPFADVCINRVGGFECKKIIHCPKGYEATAFGCMDINECATKKHNCKGIAECKNEKGSFSCVCPTGFQLLADNSCEDINECNFYLCPYNSKCVNTPGSYRCDCNIGFRNINENTCRDVDECSETPGICQHICINVFGSFRCTCKTGFRLHENNRTCTDLDECEMFKDQRLCIGECVNIPGSFTCRCPPGYTLGPDGRSCQDIDECLRKPCKGEDEVCLNTRGSFRCNSIKCPPNYIKDLEHKNRCKRFKMYCRQDDKNCLEQPLTYSFNFITFVSMLPIPPIGHLDLFTMRGPLWSGTNSQFTLDLLSVRAAQKVQAASKDCFRLRNSGWNQGVISLIKPIPGPQEIELQLTMKMYHNGMFVGSGVAKLLIHVSEFEY